MLILIWAFLKAGFAILSHRALLWLFLFVLLDTLFWLTHAAAISMGAASRAPNAIYQRQILWFRQEMFNFFKYFEKVNIL